MGKTGPDHPAAHLRHDVADGDQRRDLPPMGKDGSNGRVEMCTGYRCEDSDQDKEDRTRRNGVTEQRTATSSVSLSAMMPKPTTVVTSRQVPAKSASPGRRGSN